MLDAADRPGTGRDSDQNPLYRRIIRAAEDRFTRHGFRGVTMEGVARDAAVSKVTLYNYFRNKDDLFRAVCARMARISTRAFGEAISAPGQGVDERILAAILAKHLLAHRLVRTSPHADDLFSHKAQLAGEIFAAADEAMVEMLDQALRDDRLLQSSAPQLARTLFYASAELAARCATGADLEADLRAFVTIHLAGARTLARRAAKVPKGAPR